VQASSARESSVELPALEPAQRKTLLAQLRPIAAEQTEADGYGQRRPFPLVLALLIGLALGGPIGVGIGFAFYGYRAPVEPPFYLGHSEQRYYSADLAPLAEGTFPTEERQATTMAVAVGIAAGLGVFGVVLSFLTRRIWYRLRLIFGLLLGLLVGGPAGVGVGLLYFGLFSPSEAGFGRGLFDARGNPLTPAAYVLEQRRSITATALLGVGTGSLVAVFIMLLFQRPYHRRATEARQRLQNSVKRLESSFPDVVSAQGGPDALLEPARVGELLRAVDAQA
jgi:hypothetical protein